MSNADRLTPGWRGWGRDVQIGGRLLPFRAGEPVTITLPAAPLPAVPLFDSPAALRALMAEVGIIDYEIKQVTDADDFVRSVERAGALVATNIRKTDHGTVRWTWIVISPADHPRDCPRPVTP